MEEARRLGLVLSEDAARASEAFNDNLTRLSAVADHTFGVDHSGLAHAAGRLEIFTVTAAQQQHLVTGQFTHHACHVITAFRALQPVERLTKTNQLFTPQLRQSVLIARIRQ